MNHNVRLVRKAMALKAPTKKLVSTKQKYAEKEKPLAKVGVTWRRNRKTVGKDRARKIIKFQSLRPCHLLQRHLQAQAKLLLRKMRPKKEDRQLKVWRAIGRPSLFWTMAVLCLMSPATICRHTVQGTAADAVCRKLLRSRAWATS